jgi:flavin reductase (DIM6/NTAB) family NADH-FMN oxidoreductase RutF
MTKKVKLQLDPDKRTWHPSPLMGQIVFVTTINEDGTSNIAPKSWISMMVFEPPILAIGCNLDHITAQNIIRQKEFVVNVPGKELADKVWECSELPHPRVIEALGLTSFLSERVSPLSIEECHGHLECVYEQHIEYGREVIILAKILAVSVDEEATKTDDPYEYLKMFAYLEGNIYGVIDKSSMAIVK